MGEVYRATDKKLATSPYREFAVAPDGSYFVFPRDSGDQSDAHSFTVVENWFEAFRED